MTPYRTSSGVQIGLLYTPPKPDIYGDALRLQSALLEPRTAGPLTVIGRMVGRVWAWL